MNEKQFKVFKCIKEYQPVYLRKIVEITSLPYGTVQAILNNFNDIFETKDEGKNKYFSYNQKEDTKIFLKQLELEERKHYIKEHQMDRLDWLEAQSVYILREAYANFKNLCMLWSIGKDSTVLLWLARKAFVGHVPFPLIHIDTSYKIPQMIQYRDNLAKKLKLNMIYGQNVEALKLKNTYPDGNISRLKCCKKLKTEALQKTLSGEWPRWIMDHSSGKYIEDQNKEPYTGVIVGVRADEEG
ncbi:MAG: phosphoadenosine phosphosulfate reductase family protein, partial [Candidatus Woesearchaeota archaeon]